MRSIRELQQSQDRYRDSTFLYKSAQRIDKETFCKKKNEISFTQVNFTDSYIYRSAFEWFNSGLIKFYFDLVVFYW